MVPTHSTFVPGPDSQSSINSATASIWASTSIAIAGPNPPNSQRAGGGVSDAWRIAYDLSVDVIEEAPAMPSAAKKVKESADNSAEAVTRLSEVTDKMHALLVVRADELVGCTETSPEEAELAALTDVIESYERQRWPTGKASFPGAKG